MKRALLLGGTGAMGVYLAPELLRRGYIVDITTRKGGKSGININYITGNAKDTSFIESVLKKNSYDVIVDFMVYSTDEFRDRVELLLKNTKHYIFLSTYRVFANQDKFIAENSPRLLDVSDDKEYLKTDEYALAKARQEDILRASRYKNWTIVRPSITYSKERFQLGVLEADVFLARALNKKAVVFPEEMLDKRTTMTWAGDVAKMIAKLALNQDTMGEDYNVVTAENRTWREILAYYRKNIDIKIKVVKLEEFLRIYPGRYQVLYDRMFDRAMDNAKVLKATGLKQPDLLLLRDGLQKELQRFLKIVNAETFITDSELHRGMDHTVDSYLVRGARKIKPRTRLKSIRRKLRPRTRLIELKQRTRIRTRVKDMLARARNKRKDGLIVTLTSTFNYGNIVQRYALRKFLQNHGYNFDSILLPDWTDEIGDDIYGEMRRFINTYIGGVMYDPEMEKYKNYIVGSDQVWRNWYKEDEWYQYAPYFLEFVDDRDVNRVSYAASFGVDSLKEARIDKKNIDKIEPLLSRFNHISVREESGKELVSEICEINPNDVKLVLDPTLLLNADDYSELVDMYYGNSVQNIGMFCYILDDSIEKRDVIKRIAKDHRKEYSIMNPRGDEKYAPIEEWLRGFRDAEMVVTDSFHGVAFSIINRKNFIVFNNKSRGSARFNTLFDLLGISKSRLIDPHEPQDIENVKDIDWESVSRKLQELQKDSGDWLLNSIGGSKK